MRAKQGGPKVALQETSVLCVAVAREAIEPRIFLFFVFTKAR